MKFEIRRTSNWRDVQPIKEAVYEEYTYKDFRACPTLEEARKPENKRWYDQWYKRGINHRVENGHVVCDVKYIDGIKKPFIRYTIEINTLEELINLVKKEGPIIIQENNQGPELEIYDDYRE